MMTAADAATLIRYRDEAFRLYRLCFTEPPYLESEEQIRRYTDVRFAQDMAEPGTRGFVAWHGGRLAGLIYGWPTAAVVQDRPFYAKVYGGVDPAHHRLLTAPALEVVELMVDPAHRRQGLGRVLLERLVDGHGKAWLATHPDAPARKLYESQGWAVIGRYQYDDGTEMVVLSLSRGRTAY